MNIINESLFSSACRAFIKTVFVLLGIAVFFIPLAVIFSFAINGFQCSTKTVNTPHIVSDASGKRAYLGNDVPVIFKLQIQDFIGGHDMTTERIQSKLIESREGIFAPDRVAGIFLVIDSPGGTVKDSDGIYNLLQEYRERYDVPIYAYVDGFCASGAYYIACAADKIVATPHSVIGSIGTMLSPFFNISGPLDWVGIETKTLTAGADKDKMNPLRPWSTHESASLQRIIDEMYKQFVGIVTSSRQKIDQQQLVGEYGANLFISHDALAKGFIDETTPFESSALHDFVEMLELADGDYQVIEMQTNRFLQGLFENSSPLRTGIIKHQLMVTPEAESQPINKLLYMYQPGC